MIHLSPSRVLSFIAASALTAGSAVAQQPSPPTDPTTSSPAASTTDASVSAKYAHEKILELAPSDAWLIAFTEGFNAVARNPVVTQIADSAQGLTALLSTLAETFDGPCMLAVSGTPTDTLSWRVTFAAQTMVDAGEAFERIGTDIVSAWDRTPLPGIIGPVEFVDDGQFGYLTLAGPVPITLTIVLRDRIAFGSSQLGAAEDWESNGTEQTGFANTAEFKRIVVDQAGPIGFLLYVNLRPLIPLAGDPLNRMLPNLFDAIQLANLESIALVLPPVGTLDAVRVTLGVRDIKPGVWRLLASAPYSAALARAFPADTTLFVQSSIGRASQIMEDIKAFAATLDPQITSEYEREREEFKREVGLDLEGELLANITNAWAVGMHGDNDRIEPALIVLHLEDKSAFKRHLHTLRAAFQLEIKSATYRDVMIEQAQREFGPFVFAVVDNLLLLSYDEGAITAAIDAMLDQTSLDRTGPFKAVRDRIGSSTSKYVYLSLGGLFNCSKTEDEQEAARCAEAVGKAGKAVGLCLIPHDRMIDIELVSSDGTPDGAVALLWMSISESLTRARHLSARAVSASNVKSFLIGCFTYSSDHKGEWPESLDVLVKEGLTTADLLLKSPYTGQPASGGSYYLYRFIADQKSVKNRSVEAVISEPAIHDGGAVFGFLDGHAEWVESPKADELLSIMRSAQRP